MKKPVLILVSGIPASGKTTTAEYISKEFNCPFLIADRLKELISDRVSDRNDHLLFDKVAKSSYDVLFYAMEAIIRAGVNCVAEAFFLSKAVEPKIKELKDKYNCVLIQVHLNCDLETAKKRYIERHKRGERHACHLAEIPVKVDAERIKQAKLNCCDYTIEIDTTDFTCMDYEKLCLKIEKLIS